MEMWVWHRSTRPLGSLGVPQTLAGGFDPGGCSFVPLLQLLPKGVHPLEGTGDSWWPLTTALSTPGYPGVPTHG